MHNSAGLTAALMLLTSSLGAHARSPFRFHNNDRYAADVLPKRTPDLGLMFPLPGAEDGPQPTTAPVLEPRMLERRASTDNTCAYVSGDTDIPLYCGTDSACIFNSIRSNIGCCPDTNSRCALWTTCLPASESSKYTSSDGYTLFCGNATYPQCVTHKFADTAFVGYTLLGCGKTSTNDVVYYQPPKSSSSSRSSSTTSSSTSSTTTSGNLGPQQTGPAPDPNANNNNSGGSSTNVGAIAGGVVGGVAALALIGLGVFFLLRRNRSKNDPNAVSPSAATANTMHSPGPAPYGGPPPPPQMAQQQPGYPPQGFVPVGAAYDPNNRDSMAKYGPLGHTTSVYDPSSMGVSPPGSPPPQGHSPVGAMGMGMHNGQQGHPATSPTGTQFSGQMQSPQHTGTTGPQGQQGGNMGYQSGPVAAYHELPAQRGDGELRELA